MQNTLLDFINTLDATLKKRQAQSGDGAGLSRLTISQIRYLEAIHDLGQPTITQLADRLKVTKASVTTGINKLISQGYVTKTQSSDDRRVFHVRLTAASEGLVQAKFQALETYGAFIRAALTTEEAAQFEAILSKLVRRFYQEQP